MFRACAIMAIHNEVDIIKESVSKLISQGVDVYLIDNNSTDGSIEAVSHLVGKGIVDIEVLKFFEDGKEVYDWTSILRRKEALSKSLNYSWYLHVDADEIRYSPWKGSSLCEGLERVNFEGYNLVDFKLFNFRLTNEYSFDADFENSMPLFSLAEEFNSLQVKAWKKNDSIQLANTGGHLAELNSGNIYPLKFILKHYPIRSASHGHKKVFLERKLRFSDFEKSKGWHVQYNDFVDNNDEQFFYNTHYLFRFDFLEQQAKIYEEGIALITSANSPSTSVSLVECLSNLRLRYASHLIESGFSETEVVDIISFAQDIFNIIIANEGPIIKVDIRHKIIIDGYIASVANLLYLKGDARAKSQLAKAKLIYSNDSVN